MRGSILLKVIALLAISGGAAFYVVTMPSRIAADALMPRAADVANGETMFNIGGCFSCHGTRGQEDRTRLGGGLALTTPFGTFKVPNISSDPKYGIGAWSEHEFVNAVVRGVGRRGEHLYPAFPYTSLQRMRLGDVRDLYAYLKILPAVATPSEPHQLSFPFNMRRGLGLWKLLYVDGKTFVPDSSKDDVFNRGAYLVEGPGHCAECHSPRNLIGGIDPQRRFAGGVDAEGKGWVPNITPHADGMANYSAKDIAYLLETGFTPEFDSVGSSMADVVENTSKLSADDRAAMAAYIKALPPRRGKAPPRKQGGLPARRTVDLSVHPIAPQMIRR
jgi:mono/diheme cytochrome c family protein